MLYKTEAAAAAAAAAAVAKALKTSWEQNCAGKKRETKRGDGDGMNGNESKQAITAAEKQGSQQQPYSSTFLLPETVLPLFPSFSSRFVGNLFFSPIFFHSLPFPSFSAVATFSIVANVATAVEERERGKGNEIERY